MSDNAQLENETLLGGWTNYHAPTPADLAVFSEALNGLLGVRYRPTLVATQIVSGTNYRFQCIASVVHSGLTYDVIASIYRPLRGKSVLVEITPI
ncbi:hypothetical protein [Flavobacterium hercynium]|uniref:Cystatin domain-containing protein n=1 Tax=Flavobacterium hercynium TaxID=387094 RepID=A0A226HE27_9FLAO|nr:hypothetical protein [Flavobacterium hercynium]OXA92523.1 hypothetical protein B0A66_09590 [Flavobacterium hercynium]SMP21501.1 hypothetical protein SAMN06265346_10738 [Flavobacterium hercynium]